jgi:hypothetical protein
MQFVPFVAKLLHQRLVIKMLYKAYELNYNSITSICVLIP